MKPTLARSFTTASQWLEYKSKTTCTVCGDTGKYRGFKDEYGMAKKTYRCGCDYPDAWRTLQYPPRVMKPRNKKA